MKKCKNCNIELTRKEQKKFCSRSCSTTFNNKKLGRRTRKIPKEQSCFLCKDKIEDNKNIRKYCSKECHRLNEWNDRKAKIIETGIEKSTWVAKRYLKEVNGIKCSICGIDEWCGQVVPLVMDHIDGNSENNKIDNLRLVCGNCDMQLPTYKSKNKNSGRHYRRQRYKDGKSY
jgi:hypothetical protein